MHLDDEAAGDRFHLIGHSCQHVSSLASSGRTGGLADGKRRHAPWVIRWQSGGWTISGARPTVMRTRLQVWDLADVNGDTCCFTRAEHDNFMTFR